MAAEEILKIEHLNVTFTTKRGIAKAVNDVSFILHKGEKLGLVGESGCGKSVTSKSIMQLLPIPPASLSGTIWFGGVDLLSKSEYEMSAYRGNRISMIFQEPMVSLNPLYTIGNQLLEVVQLYKQISAAEARKDVINMLGEVGIPSPDVRIKQYPFELSGGMRQRVMIAMALLCKPEILIADEPTTALDVTIQAQILELINQVNKKFGTSIILITHDLGVVAENVDNVAVMYTGNIVEKSSVRDLFKNPRHPYTQGLLQAIPTMERIDGDLSTIEGTVPSLYTLPPGCPFSNRCPYTSARCIREMPPKTIDNKGMVQCWRYVDTYKEGVSND
jgi:peptide/nickel transport system ATP-binding protein/oligopeptide transport system ATP-binding protein